MVILALLTIAQTPLAGFAPEMEKIRAEAKLPAMGVAVIHQEGSPQVFVTGVRKQGESAKVTANDQWHLGSCTKAMTAVVVSQLVADGQLGYDDSLAKILPGIKIGEGFEKATLRHLLCMKSGLVPNPGLGWFRFQKPDRSLLDQRKRAIGAVLGKTGQEVGKEVYSNASFVAAGLAAELKTGKTIEDLLQERLLQPLKMTSAGFGPTDKGQPWPHTDQGPEKENDDNPAVMTAAGRAHMSLEDWARFAQELLKAFASGSKFIAPELVNELKSRPLGGSYAMGWVVAERPWAGGEALVHSGSNTANYCVIWVAPKRGFAVMAVTNSGAKGAAEACDQAVSAAIRRILGPG